MLWLTLALCFVGCLPSQATEVTSYSPDAAILARAIRSSRARASVLDEKVATMTDNANRLLTALDTIDDSLYENVVEVNSEQDNLIAQSLTKMNSMMKELQTMQGMATRAQSAARENRDRLQKCWSSLDSLASSNDGQAARLAGLNNLLDEMNAVLGGRLYDLATSAAAQVNSLALNVNATDELMDSQKCFKGEATVNVSRGQGSAEVVFPADFFGEAAIPVSYCAVTSLLGSIHERGSQNYDYGYGYGYESSYRELTGFAVDCTANADAVVITVEDRSQSDKGKARMTSVSVDVKACTFSAQSDFNFSLA